VAACEKDDLNGFLGLSCAQLGVLKVLGHGTQDAQRLLFLIWLRLFE
jgi:hypothetical protein